MTRNCVDIKNYEGVRVVFTEKQRELKSAFHSELRQESFIKRIEEAIRKPEFVYEDLAKQGRMVYYRYEYSFNGRPTYTKVVVRAQKKYCFVITAYRPNSVKERGKTKLLYGEDKN